MTYFKKGDWNADCERCGFEYKASQLKKEWTNLMVCRDCWEPRHPQDFVKGVKDDSSVPWTNQDGTDSVINICSTRSSVAGIAQSGCAISGNNTKHTLIPSGTF